MFKIGAFSKLVRVSARMLRHYEKCGLLLPAKIDPYTGYRFYSMSQTPLLSRITALRDMGFSIGEIGEILPRYDDVDFLTQAVQGKAKQVRAAIATEQARLDRLMALKIQAQTGKGEDNMVYDVELKALPQVNVITLREVIADYSREEDAWEKLLGYVAEHNINVLAGQGAYSVYPDDEYKESDVTVEISLPVAQQGESDPPFEFRTLEAIPQAATVKFAGSYHNYGAAMEKLGGWIEANGYEITSGVRGVALHNLQSADEILVELQVGVVKAG